MCLKVLFHFQDFVQNLQHFLWVHVDLLCSLYWYISIWPIWYDNGNMLSRFLPSSILVIFWVRLGSHPKYYPNWLNHWLMQVLTFPYFSRKHIKFILTMFLSLLAYSIRTQTSKVIIFTHAKKRRNTKLSTLDVGQSFPFWKANVEENFGEIKGLSFFQYNMPPIY